MSEHGSAMGKLFDMSVACKVTERELVNYVDKHYPLSLLRPWVEAVTAFRSSGLLPEEVQTKTDRWRFKDRTEPINMGRKAFIVARITKRSLPDGERRVIAAMMYEALTEVPTIPPPSAR